MMEPALARMILIMHEGHFKTNQDTLFPIHTCTHTIKTFLTKEIDMFYSRNKEKRKKIS